MALESIGGRRSPIYSRMEERLKTEIYFEVEKEFKRYLSKFGQAVSAILPAGSLFYRARIGITKTYIRCDEANEFETLHQPYLGNQIGAPPPDVATAGRLNRAGVSLLYLATDKPTAAAEIRPHPGHKLSIVGFVSKKPIRVADFGAIDIVDFSSSDEMLNVYHLGLTIGYEIGTPITPEDRQRYSLTQLVADILRQQGYEGVRVPSSVAPGANLCVFKPALFVVQPDTATVLEIAEPQVSSEKAKAPREANEYGLSVEWLTEPASPRRAASLFTRTWYLLTGIPSPGPSHRVSQGASSLIGSAGSPLQKS